MSVIPCEQSRELRHRIEEYAEALRANAHAIGDHGLTEQEFHDSGLFRGAIERIRGQFSAEMGQKREFVRAVLNYMQDRGFISEWESAEAASRHDYDIELNSGRMAAIEQKGCLDGNNTIIFERPPNAHEFVVWSVCANAGGDPRRNAWSGIHTRLSADVISRAQRVDGLIVWDWVCGTIGRRCPKIGGDVGRLTEIGPYRLPPPCIYTLPETVPHPLHNPRPGAQRIEDVELLQAFHECFGGVAPEVNYVEFEVEQRGARTYRTTTIERGGEQVERSKATAIRRVG